MEIVKNGTGSLTEDVKFTFHFECPYCECEFNCTLEELHTIEKKPDGRRTAICPQCGKEVLFKSRII